MAAVSVAGSGHRSGMLRRRAPWSTCQPRSAFCGRSAGVPPLPPIDPHAGPPVALAGRVVTMDEQSRVIKRGVVYASQGRIVDVRDAAAPPPSGFEAIPAIATRGTIYPGLIELHNHLAYNVLRLWDVPERYTNRDQWGRHADYRRLVSGPMQLLGRSDLTWPAVVRYVEAKCLLGGVTTSQGVALFSRSGARTWYQGIVRNVEKTSDPLRLPEAGARIADVEAANAEAFLDALAGKHCYLLHLSEGTDDAAREHFLALQIGPTEWAIRDSLTGIHSAALRRPDFDVLADRGAAMVWSPMSNLLLYGSTVRIGAARSAGMRIGLGSDWSPTGSKNLLGELKVARLWADHRHLSLTDADIVRFATADAARILRWQDAVGSLAVGRNADLLVISGASTDPYGGLIKAAETDIRLVMINGVPRYGTPGLMTELGGGGESILVGGRSRLIDLAHSAARPEVAALSLREAHSVLREAMHNLPQMARDAERAATRTADELGPPRRVQWGIALDELGGTGAELRPRLPYQGRATGPQLGAERAAPAPPLSTVVGPLELDPLTVADDPDFLDRIARQGNLPAVIRRDLRALY